MYPPMNYRSPWSMYNNMEIQGGYPEPLLYHPPYTNGQMLPFQSVLHNRNSRCQRPPGTRVPYLPPPFRNCYSRDQFNTGPIIPYQNYNWGTNYHYNNFFVAFQEAKMNAMFAENAAFVESCLEFCSAALWPAKSIQCGLNQLSTVNQSVNGKEHSLINNRPNFQMSLGDPEHYTRATFHEAKTHTHSEIEYSHNSAQNRMSEDVGSLEQSRLVNSLNEQKIDNKNEDPNAKSTADEVKIQEKNIQINELNKEECDLLAKLIEITSDLEAAELSFPQNFISESDENSFKCPKLEVKQIQNELEVAANNFLKHNVSCNELNTLESMSNEQRVLDGILTSGITEIEVVTNSLPENTVNNINSLQMEASLKQHEWSLSPTTNYLFDERISHPLLDIPDSTYLDEWLHTYANPCSISEEENSYNVTSRSLRKRGLSVSKEQQTNFVILRDAETQIAKFDYTKRKQIERRDAETQWEDNCQSLHTEIPCIIPICSKCDKSFSKMETESEGKLLSDTEILSPKISKFDYLPPIGHKTPNGNKQSTMEENRTNNILDLPVNKLAKCNHNCKENEHNQKIQKYISSVKSKIKLNTMDNSNVLVLEKEKHYQTRSLEIPILKVVNSEKSLNDLKSIDNTYHKNTGNSDKKSNAKFYHKNLRKRKGSFGESDIKTVCMPNSSNSDLPKTQSKKLKKSNSTNINLRQNSKRSLKRTLSEYVLKEKNRHGLKYKRNSSETTRVLRNRNRPSIT